MMDNVETLSIQRVTTVNKRDAEDRVTRELPLTIFLNNQELVTMLCSPTDLEYLAVGFLSSEGLVKSRDDIEGIHVDDQRGVVRVETGQDVEFPTDRMYKRLLTSGCGKGISFYRAVDVRDRARVESSNEISAHEVFALVREFQHRSRVYRMTGGVHSAALCDTNYIRVFAEDIGRHNAIDKIFGRCLMEDIPMGEAMLITSGRISSEILLKVARRNIPIIVSKSAPTDLGVELAEDLGITLVGFVRGKRMNAYTNAWRIVIDGK